LTNEPLYAPNETELKLTTLNTLLASLKSKNTTLTNATTNLSNARICRNIILYKPNTGLYDIQAEVKKYIKSLFGAKSLKFDQVKKLKFKASSDLASKVK